MKTFHYGENLQTLRLSKRIKQETIATELNISQSSYSRMEAQAEVPDHKLVKKTAAFFGEPVSRLLATTTKELERQTRASTGASALGAKPARLFIMSGVLINLLLALTLAKGGRDIARGVAREYPMSDTAASIAGWIAALAMIALFYYWVNRLEKLVKKYLAQHRRFIENSGE